jgi:O-acetyl-ADP-ribose deacetylase (regulator of RNase III)
MQIIKGSILEVKNSIIVHQVNCQGAMKSGIAKKLRDKWPQVYNSYIECFHQIETSSISKFGFFEKEFCLGNYSLVEVTDGNYVANIFGQLNYGKDGAQYTSYNAFYSGLMGLADEIDIVGGVLSEKAVAFPYGIGCGLGGANWQKILPIIRHCFPCSTIYKLEE